MNHPPFAARRSLVAVFCALFAAVAACSGGDRGAVAVTTIDSAGIAVMTWPGSALDQVPVWTIDTAATVTIGGDAMTDVDISAVEIAAFLPDGGFVTSPPVPASILSFGPDGTRKANIGGTGSGPGEYQMLLGLMYANDTIMALEPMRNRWLMYRPDGSQLGEVELPAVAVGSVGVPTGRMDDGTFIAFSAGVVVSSDGSIDAGGDGITRQPMPVTAWRNGVSRVDTLFLVPGPETTRGTLDVGNQVIPFPRPVALGAQSVVVTSSNLVWSSTGDRYELVLRDVSGNVRRIIRIDRAPRPITDADREAYRSNMKEILRRVGGMMPKEMLESELAKVDETPFSRAFPPITRMFDGGDGRVWLSDVPATATAAAGASTWYILGAEGTLEGKVTVPAGRVVTVSGNRMLVKVEDADTGDVALKVFTLSKEGSQQ